MAAAWIIGSEFELSGHGIHGPQAPSPTFDMVTDFARLTVHSDTRKQSGSFVRLSKALGSVLIPKGAELGALWRMIVEAQLHEPLGIDGSAVLLDEHSSDPNVVSASTANRAAFSGEDDVLSALQDYPDLAGGKVVIGRVQGSSFEVRLPEGRVTETVGTYYRQSKVFLPEVPGTGQIMHPLMSWWAILFALSTLARYHPVDRHSLTDRDRSVHAVPIALLLETALDAVPDLIAEALEAAPRS